ncbi:hypothetical protein Bpfe_030575 [Biomphalaria pfeifferi]|uniref:Uncharacterized protein n=1 Tax=Biomphalaria pfeifferi TaxID=112525 RepID=A0AAD8APE9_BIOPF|nr:hypothetical protein Bpfe_030575 [Biomphalaria pfeifferi]
MYPHYLKDGAGALSKFSHYEVVVGGKSTTRYNGSPSNLMFVFPASSPMTSFCTFGASHNFEAENLHPAFKFLSTM